MSVLTDAEKKEIVGKVKEKCKEGLSVKDALKAVGVAHYNYYKWSKELPKARRVTKARKMQSALVTTPPVTIAYETPEDELVIVKGRTSDVLKALALLAQGR